ncbi:MAG: 50S ribosomal protein L29 [PVC group bacterium]|nr:50S ribosomal protein L29 [PVC group bacterium]
MAIKTKEYGDYTQPELEDKLRQLEEELFNLKFQAKTSKLDKPHKIKLVRRDIARIKTFLRRLEIKTAAETKDKK